MRARSLLILLAACAVCVSAAAETLVVDGHLKVAASTLAHPHRSETMRQVETQFGPPSKRYPTVGKPPITRWDYPGFSVYFEFNRVVHAVVHAPRH